MKHDNGPISANIPTYKFSWKLWTKIRFPRGLLSNCAHKRAKCKNASSDWFPFLTLLTCVTTASRTSPLNGRKTMALYLTGYTTKPWPGWIKPEPILSMVVTAITKPYFPVHVPSTSVYSFCFTVSINCGPKYFGCSKISCSNEICRIQFVRLWIQRRVFLWFNFTTNHWLKSLF